MTGKGLTHIILVVILVVVLAMAAGCAKSNEVRIDEGQNGQQVAVKQDQTLAVKLESNPTTGYSWEVAECDAAVLQQQGESTYEQANKNQNLAGGGGWQTFHFQPLKAGETRLKLIYRRPWEKGVEPIKTYEVDVKVK